MKKLIEIEQDILVKCDNPKCDYHVEKTKENANTLIEYINKPCPKCGKILLTHNDYVIYNRTMKIVNFINKWFSWLTYFSSSNNHKSLDVEIKNGKCNIKKD